MEQKRIKKWVDRIVHEISVNAGRVNQEVRETGELAALLSKAAAGQKLTDEERGKVREQLIDLAKIVPSLAILAAPGGTLILAALLKVLPFSLLPSSFQKKPEDVEDPAALSESAGGEEREAASAGEISAEATAAGAKSGEAGPNESPTEGGTKTGTDEA